MVITRLRAGNTQFPESKEVGDAVVLASGDILCWDGGMWQLVGGRFLLKEVRDLFLDYIRGGWPDRSSALFDLPTMLDLSVFLVDGAPTEKILTDPKMVERFISRVVEVSERCEKSLQALRSE
jgi:hypothetical protein